MKPGHLQDQNEPLFYYSISEPASSEIKIKGSRFIGLCFPASNREQCENIIKAQKQNYPDASHICYGYRIGIGDKVVYRSSDAGEPSGTAGAPILQVIKGKNLTNQIIIVIRYFGGTKLGIGGLIRAYTESAKTTLEQSKRIRFELRATIRFKIDFNYLNQTMRELSKLNAQILEQIYEKEVDVMVTIPVSNKVQLMENLRNVSMGSVTFYPELIDG